MNERQAAEEFAASLAGPGGEQRARTRHGHTAQHASAAEGTLMLALADRLGRAGRALPEPAAEFRAELRARLVALAPEAVAEASGTAGRTSALPQQRGRGGRSGARHGSGEGRARPSLGGLSSAWRRRLLAAGVGVAVATGSVGGIAIASAGAEPGDPLYNAKKIFESLQLSLSGSPTDQGRDYLHLADIRLGEIDALLQRPDADMSGSPTQFYLRQTLEDLRTMIASGGNLLIGQVRTEGDATALHALSDFLLTERQRVADLSWRLPQVLQSQPPRIVALMDQLDRQLQQAAAAQAAQSAHGDQGPGAAGQGGLGTGGAGGGSQGTQTGAAGGAGASRSATPTSRPSSSASAQPSGSASGTSSPSAAASIGVDLPLPLPSIGVTVPGLLGLPAIDLGLGDEGAGATPTP